MKSQVETNQYVHVPHDHHVNIGSLMKIKPNYDIILGLISERVNNIMNQRGTQSDQ